MATNSTYSQLSASVLMEYQYRDQSGSSNIYSTTVLPWDLMADGHDSSTLIFNRTANLPTTGNVQSRSAAPINTTTAQYGYLETSNIVALNDYDPQLTDTVNLPITFSATQTVKMDVVRLHLTQGFNFENNLGMYFRISFNDSTGKKIRLLNMAYQKADSYAVINPSPFVMGGKYYASYIEFQVPSLYNLIEEYQAAQAVASATLNDLPAAKFTNGLGPDFQSLIETEFGWIVNESNENAMHYFNSYELKRVDLPTLSQFNDVSAVCVGSTAGDYIELYAAHNGQIIDNFINTLNNVAGNSYVIFHDLKVYEYGWVSGSTAQWTQTASLEFLQDSGYEDPIYYRPVIQNANASAYKIDYTVRLFNRTDGNSIWKLATTQFSNPLKYAKNLQKIALGSNPIQPKVYNKLFDKKVNWYGTGGTASVVSTESYARYITSFLQTSQVLITAQNAYLKRNATTGVVEVMSQGTSQTEIIYAQGLGKFNMTSGDTYVKFVIYEGDPATTIKFLDLNGLEKLYLNFFADSGSVKKFLSTPSTEISTSSGEVLFKIPKQDAQDISQYTDKTFTITNSNNEDETQIYAGEFIVVGETVNNFKDRKIANQDEKLSEANTLAINQADLISQLQTQIQSYANANQEQNTLIQNLQVSLGEEIQKSNFLIETNTATEEGIAELTDKVAEYEALLAQPPAVEYQTVTVVDPNCPVSMIKPRSANMKAIKQSPFS